MTPDEVTATVKRLEDKLDRQAEDLRRFDTYYAGTQPLSFLAPEVRAQVGNRLRSLNINWARKIVDSVAQRTYVEGFGLGQGGEADAELWRIWQANDLDEWSQMAHVDTLVHGRSFMSVWENEDDYSTPTIMVESAHQVAVEYHAGTRRLKAALKRWCEDKVDYAFLYLPDVVYKYQRPSAGTHDSVTTALSTRAAWTDPYEEVPNTLGVVPIVPFVNRPRVLNLDGESELVDVMGLIDAIGKLCTDMLVTSEYHAMPRRWATGIQIEKGPERDRLQAEVRKYWDEATKDKTWLAGVGVQFGQFLEAGLDNFVKAVNLMTSMVAAIGGLPPDDLGLTTTNPASAEARRAADTTLVLRTKEKHQSWAGSHEKVMSLAVAARDRVPVAKIASEFAAMETFWRSPEIQTVAQTADAAVKLHAEGIIDQVQAQEDIGLSPAQRAAIASRAEQATRTAATAEVQAKLDLAQKLQTEQGLSQNAALAAVGLFQAAAQNAADATSPP